MLSVRQAADVENPDSLSNRMRSRRFSKFAGLCAGVPRPLRIIDIGGTHEFWVQRGWAGREDVQITTVNLSAEPPVHPNIVSIVGDATDLSEYGDGSFDVAFSNSVIEHLFTRDHQAAMAREVVRVGRAYWVQTPNFWFPIEPHFHVPGWQWMPRPARAALLQRFRCGWRGPCPDPVEARRLVDEVRLLTGSQMRRLFPGATIWPERFMGLVKSWVAYGGFAAPRSQA
jgi:hypothetical protein